MEIHQHVASAKCQAGGDPGEADAPEGGEHRHQDVLRRRVEGLEHRADRAIVEMRQQVGFRQPGGARSEVEIIGVVLLDFDLRLPGGSARKERLIVERPFRPLLPDGDEGLDPRQRRTRLFGGGCEARLEQHGARTHRPHQVDDFRGRQPVVQRDADEAELRQGEIDLDELGAIVAKKRDHVAFSQSEPRKPMRQTIAALVEPAEGEAPARARAEDRLAIAKSARGGRHQGADDQLAERAVRRRSHVLLADISLSPTKKLPAIYQGRWGFAVSRSWDFLKETQRTPSDSLRALRADQRFSRHFFSVSSSTGQEDDEGFDFGERRLRQPRAAQTKVMISSGAARSDRNPLTGASGSARPIATPQNSISSSGAPTNFETV